MSKQHIQAGQGNAFVQEAWSDTFEWLECTTVADMPKPKGDLTPIYEPDPANRNKWIIVDYIQGEPGTPTTTLSRPLFATANYLLSLDCPINLWATYDCAGSQGDPENYRLAILLFQMRVSNSRILAEAVAAQPGEQNEVKTDAELAYQDRLEFYQIAFSVQALRNTAAANAITFLPKLCDSACRSGRGLCEEGYLALDGSIYNSEVKYTKDGGANWTQTATDPFTYAGGDASDIIVLDISTGHKAIVFRGSATTGEPAECAITDDWGATWTNVDIGAVNDQYITHVFMYQAKIWAVASGGYIYSSTDQGNTWTADESGVETIGVLRDICLYSKEMGYAVGDNNVFLYTTDGSEWNARTGPEPGANLLSVAVNGKGHVFVGTNSGALYRSENGGLTWLDQDGVAGAWRQLGAIGSISRIKFDTILRYYGALIYNDGTPVGTVFTTHDGGASWQEVPGQTATWNLGLNDIHICDQNTYFVVGEAHGGSTFVAKASAAE